MSGVGKLTNARSTESKTSLDEAATAAPAFFCGAERIRVGVEDDEVEAGVDQSQAHRAAHSPESDKADPWRRHPE